MNLDNCPRCGKLFAKFIQDVCQTCVKEIDEEYARCADYLRKNREVNIQELSEAVSVSVKQITKFIREGRISLQDAPNLAFDCEMCGKPIRAGKVCEECRMRLEAEFGRLKPNENKAGAASSAAKSGYRMLSSRDK
ncbi:flagellar protein [Paenibacillus sp. GCM10023250]|uniref:flagellar protein n=1 Tax=Paenibacillus sp. GCM10023250 TaxID=3252648 RepID=UPI0036073E08